MSSSVQQWMFGKSSLIPSNIQRSFENAFLAERQRQWAGDYCVVQRPRARQGATKPIADSDGHLLPGVPRADSHRGVLTRYQGTWQLPKRITRSIANQLAGRPMLTTWEKRSAHVPITLPQGVMARKNLIRAQNGKKTNGNSSRSSSRASSAKHSTKKLEESKGEYTPGSIQEIHAKEMSSESANQRLGDPYGIIDQEREKEKHGDKQDVLSEVSSKEAAKCVPLARGYCDTQIAHKMHMDNLKHQPLPDIVNDNGYKALTMQRNQAVHPASAISESYMPKDSRAAAWKAYKPGPTTLTKNKVIRPKTAAPKTPNGHISEGRPHTSIPKIKHTPIELALCWEIEDKPVKPPKRLDNTSASLAPAVFSMVNPEPEASSSSEDISLPSRKNSAHSVKNGSHETVRKNNEEINSMKNGSREGSHKNSVHSLKNGPREAWGEPVQKTNGIHNHSSEKDNDDQQRKTSLELSSIRSGGKPHHHQSMSMLNNRARSCGACQLRKMSPNPMNNSPKDEYKQAFLAGKPGTRERNSNSAHSGSQIKVPKPKPPYAHRSYSIDTLAPPFSLWTNNKAQGYPEHWRLASVYQHSYKPPEIRKKSLLNSVYQ